MKNKVCLAILILCLLCMLAGCIDYRPREDESATSTGTGTVTEAPPTAETDAYPNEPYSDHSKRY